MGQKKLKNYHYDLQSLAKSLKLASIDVIKTANTDIESHWYRSAGPLDLYFWVAKKKIVKHQITLYGQVVEWNEYDGVKTGFLGEEDEVYQEAQTVFFDKEVNSLVVEQAIEFLRQSEVLDEAVKDNMVRHFQFYSRLHNYALFRFFSGLFTRFSKKS